MKWTKLDRYEYTIMPGVIRIMLCGTNDPDLVDIMSEIDRSDGRIYVEGRRFEYLDNYEIFSRGLNSYIDIYALEQQYSN